MAHEYLEIPLTEAEIRRLRESGYVVRRMRKRFLVRNRHSKKAPTRDEVFSALVARANEEGGVGDLYENPPSN